MMLSVKSDGFSSCEIQDTKSILMNDWVLDCGYMQDFDLGGNNKVKDIDKEVPSATCEESVESVGKDSASDDELTMTVSPVCLVEGQKKAFVSFADSRRSAEGEIPSCVITKSEGFTDEEKMQLEDYMRANLSMLKKMASNIDILGAMMK